MIPSRLTFAEIEAARQERGRSALLFLTDRCPVGCAHCSVDSRADSPTISDFELFDEIIEAVCARPELQVVGISGGEPFVERRGLVHASERVVEAGKELVVYTSGVWATRPETQEWIRGVLRLCSSVFLSTDAFHEEKIQNARFVRAAQAIAAEGVWIVVQVLAIPRMIEKAESLLREAFGDGYTEFAELHEIPPLPYGRGADVFMRTKHRPGRSFGPCTVVAAPVIRYDGLVSACCNENVLMGGGPERLRRRCGSQSELTDAIDAFYADPLLTAIGGVGPGALTAHPRFADLADEEFTSICGLCWKLLARTESDEAPDPVLHALNVVGNRAP